MAFGTFPDRLRQAGQNQLNQGYKRLQSDDSNLEKCFHPFASKKKRGLPVIAFELPVRLALHQMLVDENRALAEALHQHHLYAARTIKSISQADRFRDLYVTLTNRSDYK